MRRVQHVEACVLKVQALWLSVASFTDFWMTTHTLVGPNSRNWILERDSKMLKSESMLVETQSKNCTIRLVLSPYVCTVELTSHSPHLSSTLSVKHALIFHLSRSNLVRNFSLSRFCNLGTSYCGVSNFLLWFCN